MSNCYFNMASGRNLSWSFVYAEVLILLVLINHSINLLIVSIMHNAYTISTYKLSWFDTNKIKWILLFFYVCYNEFWWEWMGITCCRLGGADNALPHCCFWKSQYVKMSNIALYKRNLFYILYIICIPQTYSTNWYKNTITYSINGP